MHYLVILGTRPEIEGFGDFVAVCGDLVSLCFGGISILGMWGNLIVDGDGGSFSMAATFAKWLRFWTHG